MSFIGKFLDKLPAPVRAGLITAIVTFVSVFIPGLTGWLGDVLSAVTNGTDLPSLSVLQTAAAAAATAAFTGFGNWLFRWTQTQFGIGNPPVYSTPDGGGEVGE